MRRRPRDNEGFPWNVPVVAALEALEFHTPVTFFVGENGSGKSTVLEGIAAGMRAIAVGSADIEHDDSLRAAQRFASGFTFERRRHPGTKMSFRAEDVFGFARRMLRTMRDLSDIEEQFRRELPDGSYGQKLAMGAPRGQRAALEGRYGSDPDARSHGELFLTLLASRLTAGGMYFLDEPEAPLSPRGVLQLIALIKNRVGRDCQFVIATHFADAAGVPRGDHLCLRRRYDPPYGVHGCRTRPVAEGFPEQPTELPATLLTTETAQHGLSAQRWYGGARG